MTNYASHFRLALLLSCALAAAAQNKQPPTPAQSIRQSFDYVNGKVLDMAKDFPEDKYDYRPTKEMRSFGELIVHIASGNVFAAKAGKGEKANWDELDAKNYKTKADIVALMQKSIGDSTATLRSLPDTHFAKTLSPWTSVTEHSAEHYGLLVAYFRLNGLVPPETRKQQQK
jgi:hypothetical protein